MYVYRHIRLDKNIPFYIGVGTKGNMKWVASFKTEYRRAYDKRESRRNVLWARIASKTEYVVEILLDELSPQEAADKEMEFIRMYGRINNKSGILANLTDGGEGQSGYTHSEETKEKIRVKAMGNKNGVGQIPSEEERKRRSEWLKKNKIALGCKHTDEHRKKNSIARMGNTNTLGFKHSEQTRANMSKARKGIAASLMTPEIKAKISEKLKGRKLSEETKAKMRGKRVFREDVPKIEGNKRKYKKRVGCKRGKYNKKGVFHQFQFQRRVFNLKQAV